MADATIPVPKPGDKVKFEYEKSGLFRVVHIDGAIGGLTPSLDIFVALYNQRAPIPKMTVQPVQANGQLGEELMEERKQREGIFREVEVGLVMNVGTAKALHQWLQTRIELAEKAQQQIQAEQQRSERKPH